MFKPAKQTAELLVRHSATLPSEMLTYAVVTGRGLPSPDRTPAALREPNASVIERLDWEQVTTEIGERLVDWLGTISRQRASYAPSSTLVFLTEDQMFSPSVCSGLVDRLGLVGSDSAGGGEALRTLAQDFGRWAKEWPRERQELNLEFDRAGRLLLRCEPLGPDL